MKLVTLTPQSSFRTQLRSDTLFGLIAWGIRTLWGEDELLKMLDYFNSGDIPFLISSAFPFKNDASNGTIYFLPKPIVRPPEIDVAHYDVEDMQKYKKYKKLRFVPHDLFNRLINGDCSEEDILREKCGTSLSQEENFEEAHIMHNVINRLTGTTGEGGLYYTQEYFPRESGLFFLLDFRMDSYIKKIEGVWRLLNDIGMGGDVSIGKGLFKIEMEEGGFLKPPNYGNALVTLSLYFPQKREKEAYHEKAGAIWYEIERRKGRVGGKLFKTGAFWKETVNVLREGSTFQNLGKDYYGGLPQIKHRKDFNVYYYGLAFPVPMRMKES